MIFGLAAILDYGEFALKEAVVNRQSEGLNLDFKIKDFSLNGSLTKSDKKNISKLLSAFSNSDGGIIVLGVDASKEDGIDGAKKLCPMPSFEQIRSQSEEYCSKAIDPSNPLVTVFSIPSKENPGLGYVIINVPKSDRRPHMSKGTDDHRYWFRTQDVTSHMEHYQLQDAFSLRSIPILELEYSVNPSIYGPFISNDSFTSKGDYGWSGVAEIIIRNTSRFSARFPYVHILDISHGSIGKYGVDGNGGFGLRNLKGHTRFYSGSSDDIVHPGCILPLLQVSYDIIYSDDRPRIRGSALPESNIKIEHEIGCLDSPKRTETLQIHGQDILNGIYKVLSQPGEAMKER